MPVWHEIIAIWQWTVVFYKIMIVKDILLEFVLMLILGNVIITIKIIVYYKVTSYTGVHLSLIHI